MSLKFNRSARRAPRGCQVNGLCSEHEMYLPFLVMFNVKLPDFLEWPRPASIVGLLGSPLSQRVRQPEE
jgi:hypothetical protein